MENPSYKATEIPTMDCRKSLLHQLITESYLHYQTTNIKKGNSMIQLVHTNQDLIKYLHAESFIPVTSTFLQSIKRGHFWSWPNLTPKLVNKHLPNPMNTSQGHQRMQQNNIQSTKNPQIDKALPINIPFGVSPSQEPSSPITNNMFIAIKSTYNVQKSYCAQTGAFPHMSTHENKYIMVLYNYNTNLILATPLPNRQAATITVGWKRLHEPLRHNGVAPKLHVLDN